MGDLEAAVADTHALIFHAAGSGHLGRAAAAMFARCEARQAVVYVPVPVIWECTLLARAGRVNLRRTVRDVFRADALRFNRDPFDALIVAAAQVLGLPLLTRDADIRGSGTVRVVW